MLSHRRWVDAVALARHFKGHSGMKRRLFVFVTLLAGAAIGHARGTDRAPRAVPNIVILYADDMGYGDLAIQNLDSKIPTPHLDRLARDGMRSTDGHSSSGVCTPSRFALLTGTSQWRRCLVHNRKSDHSAIRDGQWLLVDATTGYVSGVDKAWEQRHGYFADEPLPVELYDMEADPGQTTNVAQSHPELVRNLQGLLTRLPPGIALVQSPAE